MMKLILSVGHIIHDVSKKTDTDDRYLHKTFTFILFIYLLYLFRTVLMQQHFIVAFNISNLQ